MSPIAGDKEKERILKKLLARRADADDLEDGESVYDRQDMHAAMANAQTPRQASTIWRNWVAAMRSRRARKGRGKGSPLARSAARTKARRDEDLRPELERLWRQRGLSDRAMADLLETSPRRVSRILGPKHLRPR